LHNDVILDSILNVYVFKVNGLLCELPRDKSITDLENMSSVICGVARVRREGEYFHFKSKMCNIYIWQIWGDKKFLSFISEKWNGSRHLVFWSLGTLTGLRDRVRGLIA